MPSASVASLRGSLVPRGDVDEERAVVRSVSGSASYGRTMVKENRRQVHHLLTRSFSIFAVASALTTTCLIGCKVSETDVRRWGSTEHGPDKLVAVLTHDKYAWDLRVESALELMRMKPRSGRRIGINRLVESLALLPPDDRKKIIDGMLPQFIA